MTDTELLLMRTPSPLGRLELVADSTHLLSLTIETAGRLPHDGHPETPSALLEDALTQLAEYFTHSRTVFELPTRFDNGTPFQHSVWHRLAEVPHGAATSYGAVATAIGRPGAGRSIGRAVAANPLPIIVGCHRVLSSTGEIIGYSQGSGVPTKAWLLTHERIAFTIRAQYDPLDLVNQVLGDLVQTSGRREAERSAS
ncbi:methylated-DNA--[protein]-cysteine S-methyltransferase [Glaciibacter psychrotolerans]|uniref:methylated-DNA--[protein]-cysteine S-methyltransferase n=1 Tax=Glaciibacter psychrotolerans TaxID=670054 RepID=A0A7Z0EE94_9MICO|nr:methylated-DNA--[protein]-cysteine S-methyltransferase [Leifsonia psychrotolerans]NYJ20064.1 methylated-DNA-[protein]-cysteine S-methyltransferase [Leifsonia psychrotolerans]